VAFDRVWLEITDYGRPFDAITCKTCGYTAFFALDPPKEGGTDFRVAPETSGPYR
jgi:hypothetical protein